jgi:hypothetical protein
MSDRHLSWHEELLSFARQRPRGARIYVMVDGNATWRQVWSFKDDELTLEPRQVVPINATTAYVVTYENGEILATSVPVPENLPVGTYFVRPVWEGVGHTLSQADISDASTCVTVAFGSPRDSGSRGRVYETRLTNLCSDPVRVTHFAAYIFRDGLWRLSTIVGGFFTDKQFSEWYGTSKDGWLSPGTVAVDRENYGADVLWVYFFETPDGKRGKAVGRAPA